jgi:hypothetical protein
MPTRARRFALLPAAILAAVLLLAAAPGSEPSGTPAPVVSAPPSPAAATSSVSIVDVEVSPEPIRAGKPVTVTVHTSSNAVAVTGRALGHNFTMPKTGDGVFSGTGNVPWWARFFHGSVNVTFSASDGNGGAAQMEHTIRM